MIPVGTITQYLTTAEHNEGSRCKVCTKYPLKDSISSKEKYPNRMTWTKLIQKICTVKNPIPKEITFLKVKLPKAQELI